MSNTTQISPAANAGTAAIAPLKANSTVIGGIVIAEGEDLVAHLKAVIGNDILRAQRIKSYLNDAGERVPVQKVEVMLKGYEISTEIPKWDASKMSYADWKIRANVGIKNFLTKVAMFVYHGHREQVVAYSKNVNNAFDAAMQTAKESAASMVETPTAGK